MTRTRIWTEESKRRAVLSRALNRAKLGPKPNKRDIESDATELHAGDADYSVASVGRVLPHFPNEGWD